MALDFSTKATMFQSEYLKNRVVFAIMATSRYFINSFNEQGKPANMTQAQYEKVRAFYESAFQNPHSVRDKVAMFIISDWSENTVEIPDSQLQGIFEANVNSLAGVTPQDLV